MWDIDQPRGERPIPICSMYACSNDRFREIELHCSVELAAGQ
jgi:hypothetical protein